MARKGAWFGLAISVGYELPLTDDKLVVWLLSSQEIFAILGAAP